MRENRNRPLTIQYKPSSSNEEEFLSKSLKPFFLDLVVYISPAHLLCFTRKLEERPSPADVSHYREIKKIKARTEGRNVLGLLLRIERDLFANVGVQKTHNRHEHKVRHTTVFNVSVSWERAGAERILYRAN